MKKIIGLTAFAGIALTLSACDLFGSKNSAQPVTGNERIENETIGTDPLGNDDTGNATLGNDTIEAMPEANTAVGNAL